MGEIAVPVLWIIGALVATVLIFGLGLVVIGDVQTWSRPIVCAVTTAVRRHFTGIVLPIVALGFAWFVWPTPYRTFGRAGVMHVNRFTGAKCEVGESCWRRIATSERASGSERQERDRILELLRRAGFKDSDFKQDK